MPPEAPPVVEAVPLMDRLTPILGLAFFLMIALALSTNRRAAMRNYPLIAWGLGLQFVFALMILRTGAGQAFFGGLDAFFRAIVGYTREGATFVFGNLALGPGDAGNLGFFFAFNVLPTIIFFSAFSAVLYYFGILQAIVRGLAWVMMRTMKTSGAETLNASANIFLGQTEAPLLIRPFVGRMTRSEIHAVMTGGFATIAGGVMAAYVGMLSERIPNIAGHLMAASVMSAPAALLFSKLMRPEDGTPETAGQTEIAIPNEYTDVLDAASAGASDGLRLALNVGAMLIAFLALIALVDGVLEWLAGAIAWFFTGSLEPLDGFSLKYLAGYYFRPLAWLMGIPWDECAKAGEILGIKTIANEFIAYIELANAKSGMSERTGIILSYALCGFANLSSIGIQIGALSVMAPDRRPDIVKAAFPAMIAGTLACFSTACFAAMLL